MGWEAMWPALMLLWNDIARHNLPLSREFLSLLLLFFVILSIIFLCSFSLRASFNHEKRDCEATMSWKSWEEDKKFQIIKRKVHKMNIICRSIAVFSLFLWSHNDVLRDMNTKEEFTDTPSAPAGDNTGLVSTTESPSSHTSRHFCQVRVGWRVKVDFLILMLLFFGYSHIVPSTFPLD